MAFHNEGKNGCLVLELGLYERQVITLIEPAMLACRKNVCAGSEFSRTILARYFPFNAR